MNQTVYYTVYNLPYLILFFLFSKLLLLKIVRLWRVLHLRSDLDNLKILGHHLTKLSKFSTLKSHLFKRVAQTL